MRQWAREPRSWRQIVVLLVGVADGLATAHEAQIVHRDVKPENILVARNGYAKLADFGLAKLAAAGTGLQSPRDPNYTKTGAVLGTIDYMSPEQASGRALDARSDVFSFGVVLYELLAGRQPFGGASDYDRLKAVIDGEPPPLPSDLPESLRILVEKALEKDPAARYQSMREMVVDLRRLIARQQRTTAGNAAAGRTELPLEAPTPLSLPQTVDLRRRVRDLRDPRIALVAATLLIGAGAIGWWIGRVGEMPPVVVETSAEVTMSALTTDPGYEGEPSFAPDGETVAYVSDRSGNFDIFLRQASGGRDINLTTDSADDVQPAFSPDGTQIAFVSSRAGGSPIQWVGRDFPMLGGDIWVMPALGGSARRVAARGNFPAWSPDGASIIYTSGPWFGKKIYKVPAGGGAPQEIPVTLPPTQHWMFASYSPDGRWIVFEAAIADIYVVASDGGTPHRVARGNQPIWSARGDAIIYSSQEPGRNYSLWRVPVSLADAAVIGPSQPLTIGRGRDLPGSASRDGRRVAFTVRDESFNLEVMPFDVEGGRPLGAAETLTTGNQLIFFNSFSPDGRALTFDSQRGSASHIWRLDRGGVPQALTTDGAYFDSFPRWSPDGQTIVFNRRSSTSLLAGIDLWMMAADGANPREAVAGASAASAWLPGSRQLVYHKGGQLEILDLSSGQSRRLTNEPRVMPIMVVSPDGQWVIYQSTASGNVDLRAVPIEGGESRPVVATPYEDYHPTLSPSGRWLYFQPDHKNLWRMPGPAQNWQEAAPEQVTQFPESGLLIEDFQPSPDGRQLAFARGRVTGDVWILDVRQ